jgi:hypothetical protein
MESSTIFGSTITMLQRLGSCWNRSPVMIEFRHTLLPAPVAPGHQHVRHAGEVGDERLAVHVHPERDASAASLFS